MGRIYDIDNGDRGRVFFKGHSEEDWRSLPFVTRLEFEEGAVANEGVAMIEMWENDGEKVRLTDGKPTKTQSIGHVRFVSDEADEPVLVGAG